jgi:hypothetical protein
VSIADVILACDTVDEVATSPSPCRAHGNNLYGYRGQVQIYGIKDTYIQSTYIQITYILFGDHQNTYIQIRF